MHYCCIVWTPSQDHIEKEIEQRLKPFFSDHVCEAVHPQQPHLCWWDWYEIGGSWDNKWGTNLGNTFPVAKLPADAKVYRVVLGEAVMAREMHNPAFNPDKPDYSVYLIPNPNFDGHVKTALERVGITDGYLTIVDCHN